ncbi:MAG: hypothetical protein H6581_09425 [Bacteroidia bacterium]|nr:hypothetical protein [Bacteroidia bacterium]
MNPAVERSYPVNQPLARPTLWEKIRKSEFYVRWSSWEYWPIYIANIPVVLIWLYYALRSRSLFFFSRANPAIETGGVLGESKIKILDQVPPNWKPLTHFARTGTTAQQIGFWMENQNLNFPIICKPNVGERGFKIAKIESITELEAYVAQANYDFLVQEFVGLPIELSIMHHRFPDQEKGAITSVCIKEFLSVTGNGRSSVRELMADYPRAMLQLERIEREKPALMAQIPALGEKIHLEPIGNHCRGTTFLNGNHLISPQLTETFDRINKSLQGIYFCRYDLKCNTLEELKRGENLKILEINGVAGEPAHIYDPGYSMIQAYKDIYYNWGIIFRICREQARKGVPAMTWAEARQSLRAYRAYHKHVNN